jgi:DNA-binding FadR family transcriptional regulator
VPTAPTSSSSRAVHGLAGGAKRASLVADRIVEDVIAAGWPVGEVLGSEPELLQRYDVSRAVFREAVRLVEHQQVVRTRRGPGGGLVVTEPTIEAVIDALIFYLHRVDARLDEVFEARVVLEGIATELAASRVGETDIAGLRELGAREAAGDFVDPRALHTVLAGMSGNPALELFVNALNRVAMLYSTDWESLGTKVASDMTHAHARVIDAVVTGDGALASRRMRKHLEAEGDFLRRRRSTRQILPDAVLLDSAEGSKRADAVARAIALRIVGEARPPGELVATEPELMEEHGVSRAVLREAIRLIEHHQIAVMKRGPGGGLMVAAPSAAAVTDVVALYLARREMRLPDLADLRVGVESALVDLAVARLDDAGADQLADALDRETAAFDEGRSEIVHDLHAVVAGLSGNRVLELVALVLIRLCRIYQIERLPTSRRKEIRREVHQTHEGIADAMRGGDADLARHRMRRHLEAVATFMR